MSRVIGIDLGDRKSNYCVLNEDGVIVEEGTVQSTPAAFSKHFGILEPCLIAMEVGVHSRWASRVTRFRTSRSTRRTDERRLGVG